MYIQLLNDSIKLVNDVLLAEELAILLQASLLSIHLHVMIGVAMAGLQGTCTAGLPLCFMQLTAALRWLGHGRCVTNL